MKYKMVSWDPLTQDGYWRGLVRFEELLNENASEGWHVKQVWGGDNPNHEPWYVLLETEAK